MNKADFIEKLSVRMNSTKKEAAEWTAGLIAEVISAVESEKELVLSGLGQFVIVDKKAKKGRNPKTGEEIQIPARKGLKFKPASALKAVVKEM